MKRTFWGFLLIALGALFLLQTTGVIVGQVSFWSVLFTFTGASLIYEGLVGRRAPKWFELGLGLWLLAKGLSHILAGFGLVSTELSGIISAAGWPIVLIGLGLAILFRRGVKVDFVVIDRRRKSHPETHVIGDLRYGREPWVLDQDLNLETAVGDLRLDLTTAQITPGVHHIQLNQFVGETVVKVPDNVSVRASAEANVGEVHLLGDHRSGIGLHLEREFTLPDAEVELVIDARLRVGTVRIIQVATPTFRVN